MPYNEVLIQIFTALGYGEDDYGDLAVLFYTGLLQYFAPDEDANDQDSDMERLTQKIDEIAKEDLDDKDFLIKLRTVIFSQHSERVFDKRFRKHLRGYINSFYASLDRDGKEMVDNVVEKYKINLNKE
jgi:hypothetical protein